MVTLNVMASSTDTRPALKHERHSKTAVRLKECSPEASRSISGLHAKLDADMLLDFAIHCRQNKTQSWKNTCVKTKSVYSAVSGGRLMQQLAKV
jgi:hypothetical protein